MCATASFWPLHQQHGSSSSSSSNAVVFISNSLTDLIHNSRQKSQRFGPQSQVRSDAHRLQPSSTTTQRLYHRLLIMEFQSHVLLSVKNYQAPRTNQRRQGPAGTHTGNEPRLPAQKLADWKTCFATETLREKWWWKCELNLTKKNDCKIIQPSPFKEWRREGATLLEVLVLIVGYNKCSQHKVEHVSSSFFFFNRFGIYQRVFLLMVSHSRLQWSARGSVRTFIAPFDLCSVKCFMMQNSQYLVHDAVISQGESFVHKDQA